MIDWDYERSRCWFPSKPEPEPVAASGALGAPPEPPQTFESIMGRCLCGLQATTSIPMWRGMALAVCERCKAEAAPVPRLEAHQVSDSKEAATRKDAGLMATEPRVLFPALESESSPVLPYMEADELIADVTTFCNRGQDEAAKQLLLRWKATPNPSAVPRLEAGERLADRYSPHETQVVLEQIHALASRALGEAPAHTMADTGVLVDIAVLAERPLKAAR